MISSELPMPDWELMSSDSLHLLLDDYQESLRHIRVLYGSKDNEEYRVYAQWVQAIERVLERRYGV